MRVGSVTSTCLRSSAGDMRNLSGPISPLSSGTLPGQISTTTGSATTAEHATNTAAADINAFMMANLRHELADCSRFAVWALAKSVSPRSNAGNSQRYEGADLLSNLESQPNTLKLNYS